MSHLPVAWETSKMAGTSWSSSSKVSVAMQYLMEACFRAIVFSVPLVVSCQPYRNTNSRHISWFFINSPSVSLQVWHGTTRGRGGTDGMGDMQDTMVVKYVLRQESCGTPGICYLKQRTREPEHQRIEWERAESSPSPQNSNRHPEDWSSCIPFLEKINLTRSP